MTQFLDVRLNPVGGPLATAVAYYEGTSISTYQSATRDEVLQSIEGRNVLLATHGFNVDRAAGIDCLDTWGRLLQLSPQDAYLGILWPGDSAWAHGLDYGAEPKVADYAGRLLGPFLDELLADAASFSFASHSLGARVILQTVEQMTLSPRRLILMAGAIDDDCLNKEFEEAAEKAGEISVLSSKSDDVLKLAYPLGSFLGGIIDVGHPWYRGALGRNGPRNPRPANFKAPFQIPSDWCYGHGDYLQVDPAAVYPSIQPEDVPPKGAAQPTNGAPGWQQTWSSQFAACRFK